MHYLDEFKVITSILIKGRSGSSESEEIASKRKTRELKIS